MTNFKEFNNEDWKKILLSNLTNAIIGNQQEKSDAYEEIGYYYTCYAPAFLYKYYSDELKKFETVKANKMWYSAPCNFNDVFDCDILIDEKKLFTSALQMIPDKRGVRPGSHMWQQLRQTTKKEMQALRASFDNMKTTTGISCLSESDNSLLMWAHYANNHKGFCVKYDLLKINEQLRFSPVPVIYSNVKASFCSINLDTIEADSTRFFIESLTSKASEWSYEKEWRIIRDECACGINWDTKKKGALLDMIRPTSVILGCMAEPEFEHMVREYCENLRINLYKMEKDTYLYKLNKVALLQFDE